jgi:hypothetical protein
VRKIWQDADFIGRDGVYFYLARSLIKMKREAEALPYLEKLIDEYVQSKYLGDAHKLLAELKTQAQLKQPS